MDAYLNKTLSVATNIVYLGFSITFDSAQMQMVSFLLFMCTVKELGWSSQRLIWLSKVKDNLYNQDTLLHLFL